MTAAAKMTDTAIKSGMEALRYQMEYSVHRRHDAPEIYRAQEARYIALDDERARRWKVAA